jgi:hypothetical protein
MNKPISGGCPTLCKHVVDQPRAIKRTDQSLQGNLKIYLPARFDDTKNPGLQQTVACIDLREKHAMSVP